MFPLGKVIFKEMAFYSPVTFAEAFAVNDKPHRAN